MAIIGADSISARKFIKSFGNGFRPIIHRLAGLSLPFFWIGLFLQLEFFVWGSEYGSYKVSSGTGKSEGFQSLDPVKNLDRPDISGGFARLRPTRLKVSRAGKIYVTLPGKEVFPREEISVWDFSTRKEINRIRVGRSPSSLAFWGDEKWLLVSNRSSNFLSVVDLEKQREVNRISVPFYGEEIAVHPDGKRVFLSNSWKNAVYQLNFHLQKGVPSAEMEQIGGVLERFTGKTVNKSGFYFQCSNCLWVQETDASCPGVDPKISTRTRDRSRQKTGTPFSG